MLIDSTNLSPLECPRCSKRTLIQQTASRFKCINCGFFRNISDDDSSYAVVWFLAAIIVAVLISAIPR